MSLRDFLSWAYYKLTGRSTDSEFAQTDFAISDWWDRLPSGHAEFDDAEETERH